MSQWPADPTHGPPPLPGKVVPVPDRLEDLDSAASRSDTGQSLGAIGPSCDWRLRVDVASVDQKLWPAQSVQIGLFPPADKTDRGAAQDSKSLNMDSVLSTEAVFTGSGNVQYDVSASTADPDWYLVGDDGRQPLANDAERVSLADSDDKQVHLKMHLPLWVYLQLLFKDPDPDAQALRFPPNLPVKVTYPDNLYAVQNVGDEGKMKFEVPRNYDWFTLKFDPGAVQYVANAGADTRDTTLKTGADLAQLHTDGQRFMSLPKKWSMLESDWSVTGADTYNKDNTKFGCVVDGQPVRSIGTQNDPAKLLLDPHWQYNRFEFFDRYYGHPNHQSKRVNMPAWTIEGHHVQGDFPADPYTSAHWTLFDADLPKSVHCLPWILQKTDEGVADDQPAKTFQLRFQSDARTFVTSTSDTVRKIAKVDDDAKLVPSADRLKYYDLPVLWRSVKYYARFSDNTGLFFEDMAQNQAGRIDDSKLAAKPLIFSLDDVVLTDNAYLQYKLAAGDKIAVFNHKFNAVDFDDSQVGVYKYDWGGTEYYSGIDMNDKYYLTDYPNWTRLVVAQGHMFAVFGERTIANAANDVTGARAAVLWLKSIDEVNRKAGSVVNLRPARSDYPDNTFKFFSLQPFFQQQYNHTRKRYTGPASDTTNIGRFDLALLRCCDHDSDFEKFVVLNYTRLRLNFDPFSPPLIDTVQVSPLTDTGATLKWNTQIKADTFLEWDKFAGGALQQHADATLANQHSKALAGLTPGERYKFRLKATAPTGSTEWGDFEFTTPLPAPVLPSMISQVKAGAWRSQATVYWKTAAGATGGHYFANRQWTAFPAVVANGQDRSASLTNLPAGEKVFFKIWAQDGASKGEWQNMSFMTRTVAISEELTTFNVPGVTNLVSYKPSDTSITLKWSTVTQCRTDLSWGAGNFDNVLRPGTASNHVVNLPGVTASTKYDFRVHANFGEVVGTFGDFQANTLSPTPPVATNAPVSKTAANQDFTALKKTMVQTACVDIIARWNGNDGVNTSRAGLLPQKDEHKVKGDIIYFIQPFDDDKYAHFRVNIEAGARAEMGSQTGTGKWSETNYKADANDCYTAAHEFGHANSLPDEYVENGNKCSYDLAATIFCNTPGDPFSLDGAPGQMAMMQANREIRNRYFWHLAEFVRKTADIPLYVKHNTYLDYKLPPHPAAPLKSYAHWPANQAIDATYGPNGKFDLLLYTAGKDKFTVTLTQPIGGPYQGVLIILVRLAVQLHTDDRDTIVRILSAFMSAILQYSRNMHATGTYPVLTEGVQTQDWQFTKCLMVFSPRFHVTNGNELVDDSNQFKLWRAQNPEHFGLTLKNDPVPAITMANVNGTNVYTIARDFALPNAEADLTNDFKDTFAKMLGLADASKMTPADMKPVVQLVFPTGDVLP